MLSSDTTQIAVLSDWMIHGDTQRVIRALVESVTPSEKDYHSLRFVGGCVRDYLLGRPVKDIDIATLLHPDIVHQRLTQAGIEVETFGVKYGTILAKLPHYCYEITTLRRDIITDGRRAIVKFTNNWLVDAQRRDFTINALYLSPSGEIFDSTGQGFEDLCHQRVRFIGDAAGRIQEDLLRILRYFRFQAHYGDGKFYPEDLNPCIQLAEGLTQLSAERRRDELKKIVRAPDPTTCLKIMVSTNIWHHATGSKEKENPPWDLFETLIRWQQYEEMSTDSVYRWIVLCHGQEDRVNRLIDILRFDRLRKSFIQKTCKLLHQTDLSFQELWYRQGWYDTFNLLKLRNLFGYPAPDLDFSYKNKPVPKFPVTGHDLHALSLTPGPLFTQILRQTESWWIEQNFDPTIDDCLDKIKKDYP